MRNRSGGVGCWLALSVAVALVLTMQPSALAQETTGGIQGYVKDTSGGSIPKATVEASSSALLGKKVLSTDDAGFFHFTQLPPGEYTLTVTAPNFHTYKRTGITLDVGKLPTLEIVMEVGAVTETVEVTGKAPIVDTTTSKVAVTIPEEVIKYVPKGRSYQSLIPFAPGARQEPLQSARGDQNRANGFQIDGASDSENTYLVEGLDTTEVQNGGVKQNVIFEFVQEVQVKTSGFEAEYGGAVGGVVNVIQKRGSNEWHGSVLSNYRSSALDSDDQCLVSATPNALSGQQIACGLRGDPKTSFNSSTRTDQAPQYYNQKQDKYYIVEPGFEIGGPLLKDRLWLFASYIPTIQRTTRTVNFTAVDPSSGQPFGVRNFTRSFNAQNALERLDYQLYRKLRLYGSWQYGYSRVNGLLPATPDSLTGQINSAAGTNPTTFRADTGTVNPSSIWNFGGEWTPTSKLVVTARFGYFFYNNEDRGRPTGVRDIYQSDLTAPSSTTTGTLGLDGKAIAAPGTPGAAFVNTNGFANIQSNLQTVFDAFKRKAFNTDVSYFVSKWGTHNFKFGYGFNRLSNDTKSQFNTAQALLFWGQDYSVQNNPTNCDQVIAQNVQTFGSSAAGHCRGNDGYFIVRDGVITIGNASSYNHGIYLQDSWTVGHGLTLNLGVRFDKEFLPPYNAGADSISFGFTDKVAPRIGGAYDLLHNGKLKVFASYGKFYDIMKYSLPRGSFGGDYWHDCVYAMDDPNYTKITPQPVNGHSCGPDPGQAPGVTVGRFIENVDLRKNVISTTDPGVDPKIKPMSQHEFIVGSDWAITTNLGLEVRYARKRLDNAIEDIGITDSGGFYIGNPGPNTFADLLHRTTTSFGPPQCPTCPAQPTAIRRYDGLETRLTRRATNWFGQFSYTYSRLTGNYAGLTNTDITDGNGGRHSPNNHRDFDHPDMQFTAHGQIMDGPLSTDRPHVLGMVGWYRLRWLGMETTFGANQIFASGTPEATCWPTLGSASSCVFVEQRGNFVKLHRDPTTGNFVSDGIIRDARTPMFSQTDFNFAHEFRVSKSNEALRLGFEFNVMNLLNQASVLSITPNPIAAGQSVTTKTATGKTDWQALLTGWNYIGASNGTAQNATSRLTVNNRYGLPFLFQARRQMRLKVKFSF